MTTSSVLRLQDHRGRRERRIRRTRALYHADADRLELVGHLQGVATLSGSDRSAVVWVDEYGAGLVHPHVVLDLLSDDPRRAFDVDPLRQAWRRGVPGVVDFVGSAEEPTRRLEARSTVAVSLGSDGSRAWFLVADGAAPRPALDPPTCEALMFLAGECAGVVLHRDLEGDGKTGGTASAFTGWAVLRDVEGADRDEALSRRVSIRFLVARVLLRVVEDEFNTDGETLEGQLRNARDEVGTVPADDDEAFRWVRVLDALEARRWSVLSDEVLRLAEHVDAMGHRHGAVAFYRAAHAAAVAAGRTDAGADAARYLGRAIRRGGDWNEAVRWYEAARELARAEEDGAREAVVVSGLANAMREKGNLPGSRQILLETLPAATASGDGHAIGTIHHGLMAVERVAGNVQAAIRHGWQAAEAYPKEQQRLEALTSLGGCFILAGKYDSAEDAFAIVAARVRDAAYRVAALETYAHAAALRGDRKAFEERVAATERALAAAAPPPVGIRAQMLYYRGLSWRALGEGAVARDWLERAVSFAVANGVNQVSFDAEGALEEMQEDRTRPAAPREEEAEEIRSICDELSVLRRELAAQPV